MGVAAFRVPKRVDDDFDFLKPKRLVDRVGEADDFSVNGRVATADRFDTVLVKLTEAAFLRTLIAEHRSHVVELRRLVRISEQFVRHERTDDRCRSFWAKCVLVFPFLHEREHLFLYDVRRFPDTACEQVRCFKDWCADLFIVVTGAHVAKFFLDILPRLDRARKQVLCTAWCFHHHISLLKKYKKALVRKGTRACVSFPWYHPRCRAIT